MLLDSPSDLRLLLRPRLVSTGQGDSLEELDVRELETGALASVSDPALTTGQTAYWLNREATDPVVFPTVIAALGGGRWFAFAPGAGGGGGDVATVNIIGRLAGEGLRAVVGTPGASVVVRGYDAPGDDGGGTFVWVTTSAPNNDGTVIVPGVAFGANTAGAHWKRVQTGPLNVRWFGAHGDYDPNTNTGGTTDDAGFVRALAALSALPARSSKYTLVVPDGIYRITTPSQVRSGVQIQGEGAPILWGVGPISAILVFGRPSPSYELSYVAGAVGLTLLGSGTSAIDVHAMESCNIDVVIGGTFTYGIRSVRTGGLGGVSYNSTVKAIRFSYDPNVYPFAEPPAPTNGVYIQGAWTSTKLRVEWYQVADYSVYVEGGFPGSGLGSLEISGMIQGAGLLGGVGTAIRLLNATNVEVSNVYGEGNVLDVDASGCEMISVHDSWMNVRLRSSSGIEVSNIIRVDSDTSVYGLTVNGKLITSEQPANAIVSGSIGLVSSHIAREVARSGIWVSASMPDDPVNLIVNGDMRRFNAAGVCTLWGTTSWSTFSTTQTGLGLPDTVTTSGSPNACKIIQAVDGVMGIPLTGPLPASFVNAELTVSFKFREIAGGLVSAAQVTDRTVLGWDPGTSPIEFLAAAGPVSTANPVPVENNFYLVRFSVRVTPAMVANGLQVTWLSYAGAEYYLGEVQASFGRASPRKYLQGQTWDNTERAAGNGAIVLSGSAPPVGATDPFYGEPWLVGDRVLSTVPGPGLPVEWVFTAPGTWTPITPLRATERTVAGAADALTADDYGSVVYYTSGAPVSVTVPSGLPAGWYCSLVQVGAGQVTVTPGGGVTLNSRNGLNTAGQWAVMGVQRRSATELVVGGDTTP